MKVDRKDLLHKLLCVEPGISKRESIQQSSCVVLRRGRFYTLSQEIACSIVSGLPKELEGAVRAERLMELLDKLPDEKVELKIESGVLHVTGCGKAKIPMEPEVILPVDEVERPRSEEWQKLDPNFSEAISLSAACTNKKDDFLKEVVHGHPMHLESCNDQHMLRFPITTFVSSSCLVRGETIRVAADLGMTRGAETENWLHFHNPLGLRLSVKKFAMEKYPPLDEFLGIHGTRLILPRGLKGIIERGVIFADMVRISLGDGRLHLESQGPDGHYSEKCKADHNGSDLAFSIPGKLMMSLVQKHTECEIAERFVRVDAENFTYLAAVE